MLFLDSKPSGSALYVADARLVRIGRKAGPRAPKRSVRLKSVLADIAAARSWCGAAPMLCAPHDMPKHPMQCAILSRTGDVFPHTSGVVGCSNLIDITVSHTALTGCSSRRVGSHFERAGV